MREIIVQSDLAFDSFRKWCELRKAPDSLLEEVGDVSAADWWESTENSAAMFWLLSRGAWNWREGQRNAYILGTANIRAAFCARAESVVNAYLSKGNSLPKFVIIVLNSMMDDYESCESAGLLNDHHLQSTYSLEVQRAQIAKPSKWIQEGVANLTLFEIEMESVLADYRREAASTLRSVVGNPFALANQL